jgi:hypothetical protein
MWIRGIRQGVEVFQQIRPPKVSSAAELNAGKAYSEHLTKLGIVPALILPDGDICIPDDVANDQLRLVVVRWMKDNPTKLGQHGAFLVFAALASTYQCAK